MRNTPVIKSSKNNTVLKRRQNISLCQQRRAYVNVTGILFDRKKFLSSDVGSTLICILLSPYVTRCGKQKCNSCHKIELEKTSQALKTVRCFFSVDLVNSIDCFCYTTKLYTFRHSLSMRALFNKVVRSC